MIIMFNYQIAIIFIYEYNQIYYEKIYKQKYIIV